MRRGSPGRALTFIAVFPPNFASNRPQPIDDSGHGVLYVVLADARNEAARYFDNAAEFFVRRLGERAFGPGRTEGRSLLRPLTTSATKTNNDGFIPETGGVSKGQSQNRMRAQRER